MPQALTVIRSNKGAGPMLALAALREHGRLRDSAIEVRSVPDRQSSAIPARELLLPTAVPPASCEILGYCTARYCTLACSDLSNDDKEDFASANHAE